jgi:aspartate carbamoyltransferase catalytic subunit
MVFGLSMTMPNMQDRTLMNLSQREPLQQLLSAADLSREKIEQLIGLAEELRNMNRLERGELLKGTTLATLFYEPSTRTRLSFEAAATKLGVGVVSAENAADNSSAKKGETLEDVFRVIGGYVEAIVVRHHDMSELRRASRFSKVPIVNAGAGSGEHPSQALLDLYTLYREFGTIDGLRLCVMGDLKYGRTVHSLLRTLTYFSDMQITVLSPSSLELPEDLEEELAAAGLVVTHGQDMESVFRSSDVIYQTRIQTERLKGEVDLRPLVIGSAQLSWLHNDARIMHPLPRVDEIDPIVDQDPRAAYFRQTENGLYMRMAVLTDLLKGAVK